MLGQQSVSDAPYFWVICLDVHKKILNIELVGMGSIKSVPASPTEVFSIPVHKKARSVVWVHNHPSGSLLPSAADEDITNRLVQAGLILRIEVDDHMIMTEKSFYSFRDSGLLKKIAMDNKYALTSTTAKQMQREMDARAKDFHKMKRKIQQESAEKGQQEGIEQGKKASKMEIARNPLTRDRHEYNREKYRTL